MLLSRAAVVHVQSYGSLRRAVPEVTLLFFLLMGERLEDTGRQKDTEVFIPVMHISDTDV